MDVRVDTTQDGIRLDKFIAQAAQVSRRQARLWIAGGQIQLNRRCSRILTRPLRAGAQVSIHPDAQAVAVDVPRAAPPTTPPTDRPPEPTLLHLDRHLVALAKPSGLLSESDRFGSPSLECRVPRLLAALGEPTRLWLVHRLDACTSGLVLMARTPRAAAALCAAFREGAVRKQYLALCAGSVAADQRIDAPIGRLAGTRHGVRPDGKSAQTAVHVLDRSPAASLLRLRPQTGRTHQLRVHMAHLGHPLLGDSLYKGPRYLRPVGGQPARSIPRCMLHAHSLRVPHPADGSYLQLSAPLPADFCDMMSALSLDGGDP
jgi:23S rRNA pseudouridine1911/1915/1917 synthase